MEEIIKLEEKLNELKSKYDEMTEKGYKLGLKLEVLDTIDYTAKQLNIKLYQKINNTKKIENDNESTKFHHEKLVYNKDFFFNNLLLGLNIKGKKFDKVNLLFKKYGYQGRGAMEEDAYGMNYYNYTIVGTTCLIDKLR